MSSSSASRHGDPSPRVLRVRDVAERLDVSRSHVYRLAASGGLPVIPGLGRAVRIDAQRYEEQFEPKGA